MVAALWLAVLGMEIALVKTGMSGSLARTRLSSTTVCGVRPGMGGLPAVNTPNNNPTLVADAGEPSLFDSLAQLVPKELQAPYYRVLVHTRTLSPDDEMLRILDLPSLGDHCYFAFVGGKQ
jgi:hypothetical protein